MRTGYSAEQVFQRGSEFGELKAEAVLAGDGGEDAFAVEQFVREAAQGGALPVRSASGP